MDEALLPLWGFLALAAVMLGLWGRQRRTRNAGIVDVAWTFGLGGFALLYAIGAEGWVGRRILVALLAGAWSLRLGMHLAKRVASEPEDGRYAKLRAELGERIDGWLFWFFLVQALLAALLSLAFFVPSIAGGPEAIGWRAQDVVAVLLWCVSVVGEHRADEQLRAWRSDEANKGRTCRAGLWRYSRHPNYFFEWIHWLVYPVLAIGLPFGPAVWLVPLVMLFLILKVTGIPPTEERALASRGEDYRRYQETTNAFFPGPPRVAGDSV